MNPNIQTQDEYRDSAVAFIDLLGFSDKVKTLSADNKDGISKISSVLDAMQSHVDQLNIEFTRKYIDPAMKLQGCMFSDSIVFSSTKDDYISVISRAYLVAERLMTEGFLCRGGVAWGGFSHASNRFYGEAMVKAHELESKVAIYPRIILASDMAQALRAQPTPYVRDLIREDIDGNWFIDIYRGSLLSILHGKDKEDADALSDPFWRSAYRTIQNELSLPLDQRVRSKIMWARYQYNDRAPAKFERLP